MPPRLFAGLILLVLAAAAVTVAAFQGLGLFSAALLVPLALVAAYAVRRR
jgi:hypothetical protein